MSLQNILIAFIFLSSCGIWYLVQQCETTPQKKGSYLSVVCTTGMIADMVQALGGAQVYVICLMGPGIDPHVYRASEGDVHRLANADIIFYNGLHLEGKMSHIFKHMSKYMAAYAVTDGIPGSLLRSSAEFAGTYDPHVWLDVSLWSYTIPFVCNTLIAHDPEHADLYTRRAAEYHMKLQHLDEYVRARAAELLQAQRILVTAHDAFSYFGAAYGFQVIGLQGISTESEAGIRDISNLVDFLCIHHVPAMFIESSVSQRALQAVQCATCARGWNVVIGPELFSDALGNPNTPEATYIGMITHNIDAIVTALQR